MQSTLLCGARRAGALLVWASIFLVNLLNPVNAQEKIRQDLKWGNGGRSVGADQRPDNRINSALRARDSAQPNQTPWTVNLGIKRPDKAQRDSQARAKAKKQRARMKRKAQLKRAQGEQRRRLALEKQQENTR